MAFVIITVLPGVALLLLYPEAEVVVPLEAAAAAAEDDGAYISLRAASLSCRLVTR